MKTSNRSWLLGGLCGVALLVPGQASAQYAPDEGNDPSMLTMTGDLLIARPIGLVTTVAGAAVFLVSLPFTAAGGNVGEAAEVLVAGPARTTFVRCLGCTRPGNKRHRRGM